MFPPSHGCLGARGWLCSFLAPSPPWRLCHLAPSDAASGLPSPAPWTPPNSQMAEDTWGDLMLLGVSDPPQPQALQLHPLHLSHPPRCTPWTLISETASPSTPHKSRCPAPGQRFPSCQLTYPRSSLSPLTQWPQPVLTLLLPPPPPSFPSLDFRAHRLLPRQHPLQLGPLLSSLLAWQNPNPGEPNPLPSVGLSLSS